jgi:hypothetical protein
VAPLAVGVAHREPGDAVVVPRSESGLLSRLLDRPGDPLELGTHDGSVYRVGAFDDGRVVSGGGVNGLLRIWDAKRPGNPLEFGIHDLVTTVALEPTRRPSIHTRSCARSARLLNAGGTRRSAGDTSTWWSAAAAKRANMRGGVTTTR